VITGALLLGSAVTAETSLMNPNGALLGRTS
jgi:hypothetical protein